MTCTMTLPKTGVSIMICAGLVCTLYVMMLCGELVSGGMAFEAASFTINVPKTIIGPNMKTSARFGWIGVYATQDGNGVNGNGFDHESATWFSLDSQIRVLPTSDAKTKDMWNRCSRACPFSFFLAMLGLLLSSAIFLLLLDEQIGTKIDSGDTVKLARRKDLWTNKVPLVIILCEVSGVGVLLSFYLGCYHNVTFEKVGVPEEFFERSLGGGFIVALIATCFTSDMLILVFKYRSKKIGGSGGEGNAPCEEA